MLKCPSGGKGGGWVGGTVVSIHRMGIFLVTISQFVSLFVR